MASSSPAAPLSPASATPEQDNSPSNTPLALPAPNSVTTSRRLPPPCWTHEETLALIESYRDKWHGLRRGNLRAADWQDVADTVAVRCPEVLPAKTPIQCRHKIEKLRKRFRSERQRVFANNRVSNWPYYPLLDAMEISGPNPNPIPVQAKAVRTPPSSTSSDEEDELDRRNTRSIHGLMSNGGPAGLKFSIPKASRSKVPNPSFQPQFNPNPNASKFVKGYDHMMAAAAAARSPLEEMMQMKMEKKRRLEREVEEEEEEEGEEDEGFGDVAMAIRAFGEGFLRVEKMKMEMARKVEKNRMEMELKRTEMMLDMQRRLVDAVVKGFVGKKRARIED
ncbi:hypothetical protein LUZ60_016898 [Juncus effusus]|nr:hypothetical protein LUZ60_016898 [Juncus effusus]